MKRKTIDKTGWLLYYRAVQIHECVIGSGIQTTAAYLTCSKCRRGILSGPVTQMECIVRSRRINQGVRALGMQLRAKAADTQGPQAALTLFWGSLWRLNPVDTVIANTNA